MGRRKGEITVEWISGNDTCDIPGCEVIAHSILKAGSMAVVSRCPIHCGEMTMKALKRRWERRLNGPQKDGKTFQKGQNGGSTA